MEDSMELFLSYTLPLDNEGFLRRQCPNCEGQFKWHSGPANAEAEEYPDAEVYYCPLCGTPAEVDQWFTDEQVEHIQSEASRAAMPLLDQMVDGVFGSIKSKNVKVRRTGHLEVPAGPDPLSEPDDMTIVASPCHTFEPVKIPTGWNQAISCLVCGSKFVV